MYNLGKSALVALLTAALASTSPTPAGLLPPLVECVDGVPVGVNEPVTTLPNQFTIQVIPSYNNTGLGSFPLVRGQQQGSTEQGPTYKIITGAVSDNPGLSFTLTNTVVAVTGSGNYLLNRVNGRSGSSETDLGESPSRTTQLKFQAEYVCRRDNTPVLALTLPAFEAPYGIIPASEY